MTMAAFDPFDPEPGKKVYNPYFAYVVKHPSGTLLFDSGAHPQLATDPESRLGEAAADFEVRLGPDDHIERRLAAIGLRPEDVDLVVQSHLHFDHAGGLEWLRHAPVLVQREELAFAMDPPVYQEEIYVRGDYDIGLNWQQLDGDHDVFGDSRVTIISTPGTRVDTSRYSCTWTGRRSSCSRTPPTCSRRCALASCRAFLEPGRDCRHLGSDRGDRAQRERPLDDDARARLRDQRPTRAGRLVRVARDKAREPGTYPLQGTEERPRLHLMRTRQGPESCGPGTNSSRETPARTSPRRQSRARLRSRSGAAARTAAP